MVSKKKQGKQTGKSTKKESMKNYGGTKTGSGSLLSPIRCEHFFSRYQRDYYYFTFLGHGELCTRKNLRKTPSMTPGTRNLILAYGFLVYISFSLSLSHTLSVCVFAATRRRISTAATS